MSDYEEITESLIQQGYEPRNSGGIGEEIDRAVSERATCDECGCGMKYQGFHKPGSYRAYAYCPNCGAAFEF